MKRIGTDDVLAEDLSKFLDDQGISLSVTTGPGADVRISPGGQGRQGSVDTICPDGWIECPQALALANRLELAPAQLGRLLDHLNVKIRNCQLGCF